VTDQPTDPAGFEYLCELSDLTVGQPTQASVGGHVLAVVRTSDREVHAVDDTCTHANVSLSEGDVEDCTLECWLHGSRFDLRTGEPSGPPAIVPVDVYAVRLDGERVLVATSPSAPSSNPTQEH